MGKRERYEPGTFCWVDLATTDPEAAKSFYGELFGWTFENLPADENFTYTIAQLDGDTVCGIYEKGDERRSQSLSPYWLSYVSVEDAGEAEAKAKELGGTVVEEAYGDDWGRMADLRDPAGTVFAVWQPKDHIGASRVNDTGCFCLNQLNSRDPEKASEFYKGLFGWEIFPASEEPPYWGINNKGSLNGGMSGIYDESPSHWLVYFTSGDLEASQKEIERLGGAIMLPPMQVPPQNRILIASDPQGAIFGLFEGEVDE